MKIPNQPILNSATQNQLQFITKTCNIGVDLNNRQIRSMLSTLASILSETISQKKIPQNECEEIGLSKNNPVQKSNNILSQIEHVKNMFDNKVTFLDQKIQKLIKISKNQIRELIDQVRLDLNNKNDYIQKQVSKVNLKVDKQIVKITNIIKKANNPASNQKLKTEELCEIKSQKEKKNQQINVSEHQRHDDGKNSQAHLNQIQTSTQNTMQEREKSQSSSLQNNAAKLTVSHWLQYLKKKQQSYRHQLFDYTY